MPSPLRRQYLEIKRQHPDLLLLFQIGDFYEAFDEDAQVLSRELGVVLTRKYFGQGDVRPLAGIPVRSLDGHLQRLIARGLKVALCNQLGAVPPGKGLAEREVVRVITPGTVVEPALLQGRESNYLACLWTDPPGPGDRPGPGARRAGLAYADVSTGEFRVTELALDEALAELERLRPAELLLPPGASWPPGAAPDEPSALAAADATPPYGARRGVGRDVPAAVTHLSAAQHELVKPGAADVLKAHFQAHSLFAFGCDDLPLGTCAAAAILTYLRDSQPDSLLALTQLGSYREGGFLGIDPQALRSLEVFPAPHLHTGAPGVQALVQVLDQTQTALGGRLLRRWLRHPLRDLPGIRARQDAIEWFQGRPEVRAALSQHLQQTPDLERLHQRVRRRLATPAEVVSLGQGLRRVGEVARLLVRAQAPAHFAEGLDACPDVSELIDRALVTEPGAEAGVIRPGFSSELDELRATLSGGQRYLAELAGREQRRTGIKSLKVGFNQIFGYYLEVTRPNLKLVPADYIRKQTLSGAERFYTLELKEHETLIANARERVDLLEAHLFRLVCEQVGRHHARVGAAAAVLARLDVHSALAEGAAGRGYVRPELHEGDELVIRAGRHPMLELELVAAGPPCPPFVPNDTLLGGDGPQVLLLTAPNMAGKSVYLRQVALICLLGQIGSPVPAAAARLPLLDRIFTRIGVRDQTQPGQSSFMAEMLETARILHHRTPRSLIVLDELGRGTATADGLAVARAVLEHLHEGGAKVLFATHFHELCACAEALPRVANFHLAVREDGGDITYLHQLVPGRAERSFGLHVARLAGLPRPVLTRAAELLTEGEALAETLQRLYDLQTRAHRK